MGTAVTVGRMALLFAPRWLVFIRTDGLSVLSASARTPGAYLRRRPSGGIAMVFGQAAVCGTIVPKAGRLEAQARAEGARRARKAARAEGMGRRADRADARAERRAAREARRIMMAGRQAAMAAFACDSPTWCDGTTNDCHHCPYGREEV